MQIQPPDKLLFSRASFCALKLKDCCVHTCFNSASIMFKVVVGLRHKYCSQVFNAWYENQERKIRIEYTVKPVFVQGTPKSCGLVRLVILESRGLERWPLNTGGLKDWFDCRFSAGIEVILLMNKEVVFRWISFACP